MSYGYTGEFVLRIGMIDADLIDNGTRHPNLAQMKMSSYCQKIGHTTELLYDHKLDNLNDYDLLIISKVFTFTRLPMQLLKLLPADKTSFSFYNTSIIDAIREASKSETKKPVISIGGTGFFEDGGRDLDYVIEHVMPDYDLYSEYVKYMTKKGYKEQNFDDYCNYSIGFMTRGCFRRCSFCVNKKYSRPFRNSTLNEFLDKDRARIYLWDDNILSYGKGWEEVFNELNMSGKPFQFRQGLDIRLLTEKRAKILSRSKYYGDYIFAFDHIEDKDLIEKRLTRWRKYSKKTTKLYVLCAYDPTLDSGHIDKKQSELKDVENTFERIRILMKYGCLPYIMRYEAYKESNFRDIYTQLARWCNQPQFFKKKSFREFCKANQDYSKSDNECVSFKSMRLFEEEFPDIAKKYFDLRFDQVSKYDFTYNYGRIKTEPCDHCKKVSKQWDCIFSKDESWLKDYFDHTLDITCLLRKDSHCECSNNIDAVCEKLVKVLLNSSFYDIIEIIDKLPITSIDTDHLPQISNFNKGTFELIRVLEKNNLSYEELGEKLYPGKNTPASNKKYGENHSKLGALLDLVIIREQKERTGNKKIVSLSPLGHHISKLEENIQKELFLKLCYRIESIQQLVIHTRNNSNISIYDIMSLSGATESTIKRRHSTLKAILSKLMECNEPQTCRRLSKILQ